MGRVNWVQVAVFGLVALLVLVVGASLIAPWMSWPGGMTGGGGVMGGGGMMGGGMMGPGMMGGWGILGWLGMLLVPLLILAGFVLVLAWLVQQVSRAPAGGSPAAPSAAAFPCPHCGRFVQADWRACPYCGGGLATGGPPGEATP